MNDNYILTLQIFELVTTNILMLKTCFPICLVGISIFDFHRILRNYEIKLSESEKDEVKSMYVMRMNPDYLDLE